MWRAVASMCGVLKSLSVGPQHVLGGGLMRRSGGSAGASGEGLLRRGGGEAP